MVVASSLAGCSSAPTIETTPWTGPQARLRAGDRAWIAVFTAPTGGWSADLEKVEPRFEAARVFVTLRTPDPTRSVTQALVDLSVDTNVRPALGIEVYARTLPSKGGDKETAYSLAASHMSESVKSAKSGASEQNTGARPSGVGP